METLKTLENLTTKRLLAYYKAERKRKDLHQYDFSISPIEKIAIEMHLCEVKKMLDAREHVEKKK
jgi:hypothetical protein